MSPSKVEIRKFAKLKRNKLSETERIEYSREIVALLKTMIFGNVASYKSFNSEVDLSELENFNDINLAYCGIDEERLFFCAFNDDIVFETHSFGMQNVVGGNIMSKFDFVLVPLLAYDKSGYRIGYGKGYYDRYLSKKKVVKIGIAYSCQELESIPHYKHDVPLDYLVNEKGIIKFK